MNSTKNVKGNRKMLEVTYHEPLVDYYKIPDGLDLEDKTVVKSYWVKYRTLYIEYVGKKDREEIEAEYEDASDFKRPSNVQIEDADDNFVNYNEEDAEEAEEAEEEAEEEEEEDDEEEEEDDEEEEEDDEEEEERKYQECCDCKSKGEDDECTCNCHDEEEEETSDYMKELITCSKCEKETQRKDLYWKAGGCAYTDFCKECRQKEKSL